MTRNGPEDKPKDNRQKKKMNEHTRSNHKFLYIPFNMIYDVNFNKV